MATLKLPPDPELTFESLGRILEERLPQYSVKRIKPMGQERWLVGQSSVKGAGVGVRQYPDATIIRFYGLIPSVGMRFGLMALGYIPFLFVSMVSCKPVVDAVAAVLEASTAAPGGAAPSPPPADAGPPRT